jgi:tRNA pseudouridine38-40 synthase
VRNHPDPSALDRRFHWHVRPRLDDGAMREAAAPLLGRHDFRSFASLEGERNPVRELRRIEIRREGAYLYFVFEADSFLWKMARGLAGSLVEVGRGKRPVGWLAEALAGLDRARGGPSAPARGLVLLGVDYGGGAAAGAGSLPPPWPGFFLAGA